MTDRHLASDRIDLVRRRAPLPVLLLCLLAACAVAGSGASAATLYKCNENTGRGDYKNSLCTEPGPIGMSEYGKQIPLGVTTPVTESSTTPFYFDITFPGGIPIEIKCLRALSTGFYSNVEQSKVAQVSGTEVHLKLQRCTMIKGPPKCTVPSTLEFNSGSSLTFTEGQIFNKFTPVGNNWIELPFMNCENSRLDQNYPIKGTLVGILSGTSVIFNAESNQKGTLTLGGNAGSLLGTAMATSGRTPVYAR